MFPQNLDQKNPKRSITYFCIVSLVTDIYEIFSTAD